MHLLGGSAVRPLTFFPCSPCNYFSLLLIFFYQFSLPLPITQAEGFINARVDEQINEWATLPWWHMPSSQSPPDVSYRFKQTFVYPCLVSSRPHDDRPCFRSLSKITYLFADEVSLPSPEWSAAAVAPPPCYCWHARA